MDYNPLSPEVQDNPYPYYADLRDKAPVAWIESMQAWAVSRYADVDFIFRNPRLFSSALWNTTASGDLVVVPEAPGLLSMDPPDHTRMRKLANKGFTPRLNSRDGTARADDYPGLAEALDGAGGGGLGTGALRAVTDHRDRGNVRD